MRTLLLIALAALTLQAAPAATAAPAPADWTLPRLTVENRTIKDVDGRTVLLRGVNVNQLNHYADNGTGLPTVMPLDRSDFARMAALGFNVVRLNIAWSKLEPTPGAFDQDYVGRIREAVSDAKAHGLYTVLDMHQDAWGPSVGTPAGEQCPPLTKPGIGWDGAPEWATITHGWTTCNVGGVREVSPAVARAFQSFYDDEQGVQGHLVATWARLVAEFKSEPAVAGYDLLNEPNPGLRDPVAAADQLGRFYQRAIGAIRQAEAGGFPHLAIFEPSAIWSGFGLDAVPPRHYVSDPLVVFSPHLYSQSITVSSDFPTLEEGFKIAADAAAGYDAPLWTGEWGWWGDSAAADTDRFTDAMNRYRIGGAWWSWTQACGDPHAVRDGNTGKPQENLNVVDCPSGTPLGLLDGVATALARPYPRAVPGNLTEVTAIGFAGKGSGRVEAWYPGDAKPSLQTVNIDDVELVRVDGGWRMIAHAAGAYSVTMS
ncbi:glycoside hydrolase family 5 protein [Rhodococcus sp. NPDC059234]|uniref:glycoside hydrolase family 5 protein n=1 Tax=Rhodococcus sp. NPDC059234 TaxID=3346781 RepID=UPI00366A6EC7